MANIMIVDDSKFARKMLFDILTEKGHQIVGEAENAEEAVELYERLKPDLVTLDIIMPEVEGTDAISAVREMIRLNPKARVVIVCAMRQQEVVEECIQAGAKDYIVKPILPSNVAGVVESALNSG